MIKPAAYEYEDLQCIAIDDGEQCDRGVRIKSAMLCNKHYARLARHGGTDDLRAKRNGKRVRKTQQYKQDRMIAAGMSVICFCTHSYIDHYKDYNCKINGCDCVKFNGTSAELLYSATRKLENVGLVAILNYTALCLLCKHRVEIGPWYDSHLFFRVREHLKLHQVRRSTLPAYLKTG